MTTRENPKLVFQQGLTLVELMVAMTIGLFLLGAVSTLYVRTKGGFDYLEQVARIQETGRFALDAISRDIRTSGFNGCGSVTPIVNVVTGGASNPLLNFAAPIRGYEAGSSLPSQLTSVSPTPITTNDSAHQGSPIPDAIVLLGTNASSELVVKGHDASATALITTGKHSFKQGEILLITDCTKASIFQTSAVTTSATTGTIEHKTGAGPGNCFATALGSNCGATAATKQYKPGASVLRVYSNAYYIANSATVSGARSLYSLSLEGKTNATPTSTELLVGVDNMQITYGLDNDNDGSADQYVTASAISDWTIEPTVPPHPKVVAVRVSLLINSTRTNIATHNQTYKLDESSSAAIAPADGVLRKVFSETVVARNRAM